MGGTPLARFERYLVEHGVCADAQIERVHTEVNEELDAAVEFARRSPVPRPEDALEDMPA